MATNADGQEERVTVRAHPGEVACRRRNPLVLPAKTAVDVLFGVRTRPRLRWGQTVRFVAPHGPRLTLCGFDGLRRGDRVCSVAGRVARAFIAGFREGENPRDNSSFGWRAPGGSILRISAPRARVSRLVVPGRAGALMCRESPVGTAQLAPLEVDREVAAFRFGRA